MEQIFLGKKRGACRCPQRAQPINYKNFVVQLLYWKKTVREERSVAEYIDRIGIGAVLII